jgi:hypothetical protein
MSLASANRIEWLALRCSFAHKMSCSSLEPDWKPFPGPSSVLGSRAPCRRGSREPAACAALASRKELACCGARHFVTVRTRLPVGYGTLRPLPPGPPPTGRTLLFRSLYNVKHGSHWNAKHIAIDCNKAVGIESAWNIGLSTASGEARMSCVLNDDEMHRSNVSSVPTSQLLSDTHSPTMRAFALLSPDCDVVLCGSNLMTMPPPYLLPFLFQIKL